MLESMFWAFSRLIIIAVITTICIVFALFGVRKIGLERSFSQGRHPLEQQNFWPIMSPGLKSNNSIKFFKDELRQHPERWVHLPLFLTEDAIWVVARSSNLSLLIPDSQKSLSFISYEELHQKRSRHSDELGIWLLSASEVMESLSPKGWWIEILAPRNEALHALENLIIELGLEESALIQSPYAATLISVRNRHPLWLYAQDTAELGKLKLFNSFYIEPLATINADAILDEKLDDRLVTELKRRKKRFVLLARDDNSKLTDELETRELKDLGGILTTQPDLFPTLVD